MTPELEEDLHKMLEGARRRVPEITPREAAERMASREVKFLDVREASEWAGGHLADALHVPVSQVEEAAHSSLVALKDEPIVVYCSHGVRSLLAADSLKRLGFTDVSSIEGGIVACQDQGFPIERDT